MKIFLVDQQSLIVLHKGKSAILTWIVGIFWQHKNRRKLSVKMCAFIEDKTC